jgi:DNA mismatch repair protein MutS
MPAAVLRQARQTLDTLEAQQHAGESQIDLFAPVPEPEPAPLAPSPAVAPVPTDPLAAEVLQALRALDPDTLTPRSALDALYQLQALATRTP